ncbi:hypothetical protein DV515_00002728 [Chloebia gouldiae]|uniref:dCMP deaminase n=1 Tax=Chloebia gouldiae TaxID=44316 RepID=A0A3L8SUW1_CHLGU|nr:hypothetical protein DV515_00002728 [Chloebia gouldiae]
MTLMDQVWFAGAKETGLPCDLQCGSCCISVCDTNAAKAAGTEKPGASSSNAASEPVKLRNVCHAELNAIMNKNSADVKGCSMYVALFPCNECAKLIIQAGIKEVIFMSDKYHDTTEMTAARRMFDLAGIIYREFKPKCNKIIIDFDSINNRPSQKLL